MRRFFRKLLKNELFLVLLNGVFAYVAMNAIILATIQIPPEAILDSGLDQILLVFEG
jgi:hypothetical protein